MQPQHSRAATRIRLSKTYQVKRQIRTLALVVTIGTAVSGCAWISRVSAPTPTSQSGALTAAVSETGRYIVYAAEHDQAAPNVPSGIFLRDTLAGTTQLVSVAPDGTPANNSSSEPAITPDGRFIAFTTDADNLDANDTNDLDDIYLRDRVLNTTTRMSVTSAGEEVTDESREASISDDGRYVVFTSDSDDLDPSDGNGSEDGYLRDRATNKTRRVTVSNNGVETDSGAWDSVISGDGRFVAFTTDTDLTLTDQNSDDDVYVRNLAGSSTFRVSRPKGGDVDGGGGWNPSISRDGRYVAFQSPWTDLETTPMVDTNNTLDVFLRDTSANTTTRVSLTDSGGVIAGMSFNPSISRDGTRIAFTSTGTVTGFDGNGAIADGYVRDRALGRTLLVSTTFIGGQLPVESQFTTISGDGKYAVWRSLGAFVGDDSNGLNDIYARSVDVPRPTGATGGPLPRGASRSITISGSGFLAGAFFQLPTGVTAGTPTVTPTSITVTLTAAAGAAPGTYDFNVLNPGTGPGIGAGGLGICPGCLTIT